MQGGYRQIRSSRSAIKRVRRQPKTNKIKQQGEKKRKNNGKREDGRQKRSIVKKETNK